MQYFFLQRCAVHSRGFQYLFWYLLEIGVQHPHDDRQVDHHQDDDQADQRIKKFELNEQQINRIEDADGRQHFG